MEGVASQRPVLVFWDVFASEVNSAHLSGAFLNCQLVHAANAPLAEAISSRFTGLSVWSDTSCNESGDLVAFGNVENFKAYRETGKSVVGGTCMYCVNTFTHASMGIPIAIIKDGAHYRVDMVDICCGFECACAQLLETPVNDPLLVYVETAINNLKTLHLIMHPSAALLRRAQPRRLSPGCGGSLKRDYHDGRQTLVRATPNIICTPARVAHISPQ